MTEVLHFPSSPTTTTTPSPSPSPSPSTSSSPSSLSCAPPSCLSCAPSSILLPNGDPVDDDDDAEGGSSNNSVAFSREREAEGDQLSLLTLLIAIFRKSLVACKSDTRDLCAMEISWPTNVRHVAHVTFDRFNGFLGLPVEFEPEVPRRAPSARYIVPFFFPLFFCLILPFLWYQNWFFFFLVIWLKCECGMIELVYWNGMLIYDYWNFPSNIHNWLYFLLASLCSANFVIVIVSCSIVEIF